jgi:hypothetical protein
MGAQPGVSGEKDGLDARSGSTVYQPHWFLLLKYRWLTFWVVFPSLLLYVSWWDSGTVTVPWILVAGGIHHHLQAATCCKTNYFILIRITLFWRQIEQCINFSLSFWFPQITCHRPPRLWPWASHFTSIASSFEWDVNPRFLVPECLCQGKQKMCNLLLTPLLQYSRSRNYWA